MSNNALHTKTTYNANTGTHGAGREVGAELSLDDTTVSVGASDFSPDDTDLGSIDFTLGTVHVGDTLAQVKVRVYINQSVNYYYHPSCIAIPSF